MSKSIALGLLRSANNGEQLLQILDTLVEDVTEANINDFAEYAAGLNNGTLQPIAFWWYSGRLWFDTVGALMLDLTV